MIHGLVRLLPAALIFLGACRFNWEADEEHHSCDDTEYYDNPDERPLPHECFGDPPPPCSEVNCAELGGICVSGKSGIACVFEDERCPESTTSVCRGEAVHACRNGHVQVAQQSPCAAPKQCIEAAQDGQLSFAVCAEDPTPCRASSQAECRGNVAVTCGGGYPRTEEHCDGEGFRCHETVELGSSRVNASCAPDVICPEGDAPFCDGGRIVACSPAGLPRLVLDCAETSERCASPDGVVGCFVSANQFAPIVWRAIPGGTFVPSVGVAAGAARALPTFEMLRAEVTTAQFAACERAGACARIDHEAVPALRMDLPQTHVRQSEAAAFCAWIGGRLPTGHEWEYAARNAGEDVAFPWGNSAATCKDVGYWDPGVPECTGATMSGCSHPRDVTAQGVCDLVGNVQEWVLSDTGSAVPAARGWDGSATANTGLTGTDAVYTCLRDCGRGFRCVR